MASRSPSRSRSSSSSPSLTFTLTSVPKFTKRDFEQELRETIDNYISELEKVFKITQLVYSGTVVGASETVYEKREVRSAQTAIKKKLKKLVVSLYQEKGVPKRTVSVRGPDSGLDRAKLVTTETLEFVKNAGFTELGFVNGKSNGYTVGTLLTVLLSYYIKIKNLYALGPNDSTLYKADQNMMNSFGDIFEEIYAKDKQNLVALEEFPENYPNGRGGGVGFGKIKTRVFVKGSKTGAATDFTIPMTNKKVKKGRKPNQTTVENTEQRKERLSDYVYLFDPNGFPTTYIQKIISGMLTKIKAPSLTELGVPEDVQKAFSMLAKEAKKQVRLEFPIYQLQPEGYRRSKNDPKPLPNPSPPTPNFEELVDVAYRSVKVPIPDMSDPGYDMMMNYATIIKDKFELSEINKRTPNNKGEYTNISAKKLSQGE